MHYYLRILSIILLVPVLLTGCKNKGSAVSDNKNEAYNSLVSKVDSITPSAEGTSSDANQAFDQADDSQKTAMALDMADDMAIAQSLNIVTGDMLVMAGKAVKAYPHPILLNNYAAMLLGSGRTNDALYFFQLSLNQEPDNAILLTNIANVYLELENYSESEQYAKRALMTTADFGPAYQVLTTIHLKNRNYELAAETMIKSAKHCFNSITMYHFDSFLDAVLALNPAEDEYPLEEEFIEDLCKIARENVDTKEVNSGTDTPGGQIKIKPFPSITGADNLLKSRGYLADQREKFNDKMTDAQQRYDEYYNALSDHLDTPEETEPGKLPVKKNLRQVYAHKVLRSYYEYKIKQAEEKLNKKVSDVQTERDDKLAKTADDYYLRAEEARNKAEEASDDLLADMIRQLEGNSMPDPRKAYEAGLMEYDIQIEQAEKELLITKQYLESIITPTQDCYAEIKQIMEEFWLRSGGILKYLNVEDVYNQLDIEREMLVYEHISQPIGLLEQEADFLFEKDDQLESIKRERQILIDSLSGAIAEYEEAKENEEEEEQDQNKESIVPDIEKDAISEYPEKNVLGDIGFGGSLFGLVSGSVSYDGEKFGFDADTPFAGIGGERYFVNGRMQKDVYYAVGSRVEGSTEWITDSRLISDSLKTSGSLARGANKLGKIGFGFTEGTKTGEYITTDENNRIIDRGIIHIRESGGEVWKFGKSNQVIVKKSYMTGVATKKTTTKYNFDFATYSR